LLSLEQIAQQQIIIKVVGLAVFNTLKGMLVHWCACMEADASLRAAVKLASRPQGC
jgi:hypothetical protein